MSSSPMNTLTKRLQVATFVEEALAEPGVGDVQCLQRVADGPTLHLDLAQPLRPVASAGWVCGL